MSENKRVVVLNKNLPLGQLVNSAAVKIHFREVTDA